MKAGFEDTMAVMSLPEQYRKRLRSTNMQERLNSEYPVGIDIVTVVNKVTEHAG